MVFFFNLIIFNNYRNASFKNLKYLTVDQTIIDIAILVETIRNDFNESQNSPVILWGSGLGATLATWTKQKFPHIINAVWSSSGIYQHTVTTSGIYILFSIRIIYR